MQIFAAFPNKIKFIRSIVKNLISTLLFVLLFYKSSVYADQYLITSPIPEDYKKLDIIVYETSSTVPSFTSAYIPQIDLAYGLLPNLEVDLYLNYAYFHPYIANLPITNGVGDTFVEAVYRFLTESKYLPSIAFEPAYTIPTGDVNKGLGNGKPVTTLPFYAQKTFGTWQVLAGAGYVNNTSPLFLNYFFGGARVNKDLTDKLNMGVEIYEQGASTNSALIPGPEDNSFEPINIFSITRYTLINSGISYKVTKNFVLQASAGKSIIGTNIFISYLGFDWTI